MPDEPNFAHVPSYAPTPTWMTWVGRVISALPILMLTMSGVMKLSHSKEIVEGFGKAGFAEHLLTPIGIVELIATILYAIPQTAVLGAILLTGYLGGATCTHVRLEDGNFVGAVVFGVLVWLGLFFRDSRVRSLAPWRFL